MDRLFHANSYTIILPSIKDRRFPIFSFYFCLLVYILRAGRIHRTFAAMYIVSREKKPSMICSDTSSAVID